jgi:hypothetical protein
MCATIVLLVFISQSDLVFFTIRLLYIAGDGGWFGPQMLNATTALVRVRVWTLCDLAAPDYMSQWLEVDNSDGMYFVTS